MRVFALFWGAALAVRSHAAPAFDAGDLGRLFDNSRPGRDAAAPVAAGPGAARDAREPAATARPENPREPPPSPEESRFAQPEARAPMVGRAKEILEAHRETRTWDGRERSFTAPSGGEYRYQWLWDSVFHAIGTSRYDPGFAREELETLLESQHPDGLLPHMSQLHPEVYRDRALRAFGRALKRLDPLGAVKSLGTALRFGVLEPLMLKAVHGMGGERTSKLTQPPIVVEGVLAVAERLPGPEGEEFLRRAYPRLLAYFDWLDRERDPDRDGLIAIHHAWETGADSSPRWDLPYGLGPGAGGGRVQLHALWTALRRRLSASERSPFEVEAVDMNAYYFKNLAELAGLARRLGDPESADELQERLRRTREAVTTKLWDEELGTFVDLVEEGGREIPSRVLTPFGLLTLYAGILDPQDPRVDRMVALLSDPKKLGARYGVPTVSPSEPSFDPSAYWRGTSWVNVNYFLARALFDYGRRDEAKRLIHRTFEMVERGGFAEYFDPGTARGHGAEPYSWTAALLVEMDAMLKER